MTFEPLHLLTGDDATFDKFWPLFVSLQLHAKLEKHGLSDFKLRWTVSPHKEPEKKT